jgi:hypothetical protein
LSVHHAIVYLCPATSEVAFNDKRINETLEMDYNQKLIEARLHAMESVLLNLVARDADVLGDVRKMLSREHDLARTRASQTNPVGFPRMVHGDMTAPPDTDGLAARVEAYGRLRKMFGPSVGD